MNCKTHTLIIVSVCVMGGIALLGALILAFLGKAVPGELWGLAPMVVTGFFGHLPPSGKNENQTTTGDVINVQKEETKGE